MKKRLITACLALIMVVGVFAPSSAEAADDSRPTDPDAPSLGIHLDRDFTFRPEVRYTSLSGGEEHVAALRPDGSLWIWGQNQYGQLGFGTDRTYNAPVKIMEDVIWTRAYDDTTLAIKSDGSLWAWGHLAAAVNSPGVRMPRRVAAGTSSAAAVPGLLAAVTQNGDLMVYEDGLEAAPIKYASGIADVAICAGASSYGTPPASNTIKDIVNNLAKSDYLTLYIVYALGEDGTVTRYFNTKDGLISQQIARDTASITPSAYVNCDQLLLVQKDGTLLRGDGGNTNKSEFQKVSTEIRTAALNKGQLYGIKRDGSLWYLNINGPMAQGVTALAAVGSEGAFCLKNDGALEAVNSTHEDAYLAQAVKFSNQFPAYPMAPTKQEPYYSKALEIIGNATDDYEKVRRISKWMDQNIKYDHTMKNHSGLIALQTGVGVCDAYSSLTQSMLLSLGIPCNQMIDPTGIGHAWNMALIDGSAMFIDNTNHQFNTSLAVESQSHSFRSGGGFVSYHSAWAAEPLHAVASAGLLEVNPDYCRDLTKPVTRAQFCAMARRILERATGEALNASGPSPFTDTADPNVLALYRLGIVQGTSATSFGPNNILTREQLASMLYRLLQTIEHETGKRFLSAPPSIERYTDRASVSPWAAEGVGALTANGIMDGTSATTLSPKALCTVEQSFLLVYRLYTAVQ